MFELNNFDSIQIGVASPPMAVLCALQWTKMPSTSRVSRSMNWTAVMLQIGRASCRERVSVAV